MRQMKERIKRGTKQTNKSMKLTNEAKSKEKNKKKKAVFDRVVHKTMTSPGLFFITSNIYIPCNAVKTGSELRIWNAKCGQQLNGSVGSIVASLKVLGLNPVPTTVQRSAC